MASLDAEREGIRCVSPTLHRLERQRRAVRRSRSRVRKKPTTRSTAGYQRENEYESLAGVVYDFRADFVLPNATQPKAFIEVRKSSARHPSLYAKDKMFSAINWKGKTPKLLAVLVVDGEWTGETLRVMANVFAYVVPISRVVDLVGTLEAYL